jgi:hypothetical protein
LIYELVPCLAAVVDEIIVGFEDAVGEPVIADELPDVFHRVEFGTFRRQWDYGDVRRHNETRRQVPSGLIDQEYGVGAGRDDLGDLRQMQVHRFGIAGRQYQGSALAVFWADRTEDVGGGGALVAGSAWAGATFRPAAGNLVLLTYASLVCEPDFYRVAVERLLARDFVQARGKTFLKSSIAPAACAWWRGRAESLR